MIWLRRTFLALAAGISFAIATPATAQTVETPPEEEVAWDSDWDRVRGWEYAASGTLMAAGLASRFILPDPDSGYVNGVLFDEALYNALRPETDSGWRASALTSDIGFVGSMVYRFVDVMVIGIAHDAWDVAWQVGAMDFESFSIIASSLWVPQTLGVATRERPSYQTCGKPDHVGQDCSREGNRYRSFYNGHTAVAMAATGQTCVHHWFMPIYGGGFADAFACGAMIGVTAITGATRLASGKHWASDTVVGLGIGAASGFLVPLTLHYGFQRNPTERSKAQVRLLPIMYGEHPGLVLHGGF